MSDDYGFVYHEQALERLLGMSRRTRQTLFTEMEVIRQRLEEAARDRFTDETGKVYYLHSTSRHHVTYLVDHAVKTVEIVAIENA